jgi:hypothetical protein
MMPFLNQSVMVEQLNVLEAEVNWFNKSQMLLHFPNGGIRNTFEARGYTAWDPTSPAFMF